MDLWYNFRMKARMRRGQAALEYVLATASVLVVVGILWGFISLAQRQADRAEGLVTSDVP